LSNFWQFSHLPPNLPPNQTTKLYTQKLCNQLIRYGFHFGQARGSDTVPDGAFTEHLRADIIAIAETEIARLLALFRAGFAHLPLATGTVHSNPVLDLLLMRSGTRDGCKIDDVLNEPVELRNRSENCPWNKVVVSVGI
jgi:hypothetical protein